MFARRSLSCSSSMLRKCKPPKEGECQCQAPKEPCEVKLAKKAKSAGRQCEASEAGAPGPVRDSGIPDHCSKGNALECVKKLQELQKQWEEVARMCDPGERAAPKSKRPGCPVQPPAREEGGTPVVLLLAGAALIAAIVWWVINNKDELEKGKDKKEKDEKKDEGGS